MSIALSRNERIRIDGVVWAVERRVNSGIQLIGVGDGALRIVTDEEILALFREDRLWFLNRILNTDDVAALNPLDRDFLWYSPKDRAGAERRSNYLSQIRAIAGPPPYSNRNLQALIEDAAQSLGEGVPQSPHPRTVRRWLAADEKMNGSIRAQLPARETQGNRSRRFPEIVEQTMQHILDEYVMCPKPAHINEIYSTLVKRLHTESAIRNIQLPIPSLQTFYRRAQLLDDEEVVRLQEGPQVAKQRYRSPKSGPEEIAPLAASEADHLFIPYEVTDDKGDTLGAPTLTVGLDRATRMPLGFALTWEPPSYVCVMLLLRHMISDKSYVRELYGSTILNDWPCYGVPSSIIVDNAKEFHSTHFINSCRLLGISRIEYAPTRSPSDKGRVERFIRTLQTGLFDMLPGITLHARGRPKDYNPNRAPRMPLAKLNELLHKFLIDIYSQRFHRALGCAPVDAWRRGVEQFPVRLPSSANELEFLTCGIKENCAVRREGIELHSLYYSSDALERLFIDFKGQLTATIRHDPSDIGHIWVTNPRNGEVLRVPCRSRRYALGRTLWQHQRVLQHMGDARRATEQRLLQATAELRQLVDEISGRKSNRKRSKKSAARFRERPVTPDELARLALLPTYSSNEEAFAPSSPNNGFHEAGPDASDPPAGRNTCEVPGPHDETKAIPESHLSEPLATVPEILHSDRDLDDFIRRSSICVRRHP
jgi:putative transposase